MSTNHLPRMIRAMRNWFHNRAQRRAEFLATDELYHEPDQLQLDIGLRRDGVRRARSNR